LIRRQWRSFDFALLLLVLLFAAFGVLMVGEATSFESSTFSHQQLFYASGICVMIVTALVDYRFIGRFYLPLYAVIIGLLIFCLTLPADQSKTQRWIDLGAFTIQPSEFTKLFMIIFLSRLIDKKKETFNNILVLSLILLTIAVPVALIMKQPALSAGMVVIFISVCIIFSAGLKARYIVAAVLIITPIIIIFVWDLQNEERVIINKLLGYQVKRIDAFLNPTVDSDAVYQTNYSMQAIGAGQLTGKELDIASRVPHSSNDFIFAVIGERFGFTGCSAVLIAMFAIIIKCVLIANRAVDLQGKLICMGVAGMLAFQTFANVGVATAIIPNTGMPFPFLSSGGSAMWVNMAAIGLALNVGMLRNKSVFEG
jgi:rod shape determining protein RodA